MDTFGHQRSYGHQYDGYCDGSTMAKVQQQYWSTKQVVLKKLGKKEDDCIISSDAELDAKLELFSAIKDSSTNLMRVLEMYQDKLCVLAQEENSMGRFLKDCGKHDKTRAGKMMAATGKTLSFTAQKRLELRAPLVRLYQEVETFQFRAIADTALTVGKMEKSRTAYRGNLLWMKDISQQLDPDMNKQLEKFRKVQGHVRRSKVRFDKLKVDTLQKVDLLAASRCNMFSHALVAYQNTLFHFWEKTSRTMSSVAETFRGYQHYEFNMLKELTESSKKLAEETSGSPQLNLADEDEDDKDRLIFFDAEYHDEVEEKSDGHRSSRKSDPDNHKSDSLQNLYSSPSKKTSHQPSPRQSSRALNGVESKVEESLVNLLDSNSCPPSSEVHSSNSNPKAMSKLKSTGNSWQPDLLTHNPEIDDLEKDDLTLLNEILNFNAASEEGSFSQQWQAAFGNSSSIQSQPSTTATSGYSLTGAAAALEPSKPGGEMAAAAAGASASLPSFLPSQLLDMNTSLSQCTINNGAILQSDLPLQEKSQQNRVSPKPMSAPSLSKKNKNDMSAWFSLFADLDPLANPDAVGHKEQEDDRSC